MRIIYAYVEYQWKGNVRELENVIERMVVTSNDDELTVEHLPESVRKIAFTPERYGKMKTAVEQFETYLLAEAYKEYRSWNMVAKKLGIDPATAYRKASKYGLIKL